MPRFDSWPGEFPIEEWDPEFRRRVSPDGKTYGNVQEEPVRQWAAAQLVKNFGVPHRQIKFEEPVKYQHERKSARQRAKGFRDIVVYDDRYNEEYMIVEALTPEDEENSANWNSHYDYLNLYMAASASARFAILANGVTTRYYEREFQYPRKLKEVTQLPPFEKFWEKANSRQFRVLVPKRTGKPEDLDDGLQVLNTDNFRKVLGDERVGCHRILRDKEGKQPQEAVDEMVKLIFAKYYDERDTLRRALENPGKEIGYAFNTQGYRDNKQQLLQQIQACFEAAKKAEQAKLEAVGRWDASRAVFPEDMTIDLRPDTVFEIVQRFEPYSFTRSPLDVKGRVFEGFLGTTFRAGLGQYFTPEPVVRLMVGILDPGVDDVIGDPACGSARMLTHCLEHVRLKRGEGADESRFSEGFNLFRANNLFAADISPNLVRLARVNAALSGAPEMDIRLLDSLLPIAQFADREDGNYRDIGFVPDGLTMAITNPPFGSTINDATVLREYWIAHKPTRKGETRQVRSAAKEVLFINRCLDYLRPGGRLGIVLPDGVLANSSMQYVRDGIVGHARLKAVVSLPQHTFTPFGAGVKTSVLFVEKKGEGAGMGPLFDERDGDYPVYMARVDEIGYDATGRESGSDEIDEVVADFHAKVGWK
jgi:type I restriction enzyme M protein